MLFSLVDATVVLDDGTVWGTCNQFGVIGVPIACRWNGPGDIDVLSASHVYAADAAYDWGGTQAPPRLGPFIWRAIFNGMALPFPADTFCSVAGGCEAEVRDFSLGGAVIVGTATLPAPGGPAPGPVPHLPTAFVYTSLEGMLRLPDLAGGAEASGAYAITPDGLVIGGFGTDASGQEAVVWIDRAPVRVEDLVLDAGGELPEGWMLLDVRAISDDGRVLVGNAINPAGNPEGYRIAFACPLGCTTTSAAARTR
jgi:hypothetical protein